MMCINLHCAYHSTCSFMEVINPSGMKAGVSGCPNLGLMMDQVFDRQHHVPQVSLNRRSTPFLSRIRNSRTTRSTRDSQPSHPLLNVGLYL